MGGWVGGWRKGRERRKGEQVLCRWLGLSFVLVLRVRGAQGLDRMLHHTSPRSSSVSRRYTEEERVKTDLLQSKNTI